MNINWKVRFHNPVFIAQVVIAIFVPILAQLGMSWNDVTSWPALWDIVIRAAGNPVIVVAVVVSVWNAVTDPTTAGLSDSVQALTYEVPKKS